MPPPAHPDSSGQGLPASLQPTQYTAKSVIAIYPSRCTEAPIKPSAGSFFHLPAENKISGSIFIIISGEEGNKRGRKERDQEAAPVKKERERG